MMTKKCSFLKLFVYILIFSLPFQTAYSEELNKWTVAAEEFVLKKGQANNSVTKGISETVPRSILENLNRYFLRNVKPDEELDRIRYDLRKKRQSLYLQLSSEYQKKDTLFLTYSGRKLEKKVEEQNKIIKGIEDKIDKNLEELKKAETEAQKKIEAQLKAEEKNKKTTEKAEAENQDKLLESSGAGENIINDDIAVIKSEEIELYGNNSELLFKPSEKAKKQGYESALFNEEMCENGIKSYLAGNISIYGNYISVFVDVYLYPGAKKIGTVAEIGSTNDLEFIASSIVSQLIPLLTNSMPVVLNFSVNPDLGFNKIKIYLDDVLQKTDNGKLIIDSGVHTFQIVADGYKSLSTSYFFEGDTKYNIQVNLEEKKDGNVFVQLKSPKRNSSKLPAIGELYTNGIISEKLDENHSKIIINGSKVLGEFISEDGHTAFFYIPENLYHDQNYVTINPKAIDRSEYIEKRRKWMYGSYSAFILSLIPTFVTKGIFLNQRELYYDGNSNYQTASGWQKAANICVGVTVGLGVFWGIELVRYLISANSVLPEKAKQGDAIEFTNTIDYNYQERIEKEKLEKEKAKQKKTEQEKDEQKKLKENKLEESENNMSDNDIPEKADKKLKKDDDRKAGLENKTKESSTEDVNGDIKNERFIRQ